MRILHNPRKRNSRKAQRYQSNDALRYAFPHLSALPFPKITEEDDNKLTAWVDRALQGDTNAPKEIDTLIYSLFELDEKEIELIQEKP